MLQGGVGKSMAQLAPLVAADLGDRIGLRPVERRAVQGGDRPGVVQERVRVAHGRAEPEFIHDVGATVAGVVDVDPVQHLVAELEKVGSAGRILQRDVVADDGDGVGTIGADKGVGVGVVGNRVLGDLRGLTMRGHATLSLQTVAAAAADRMRATSW